MPGFNSGDLDIRSDVLTDQYGLWGFVNFVVLFKLWRSCYGFTCRSSAALKEMFLWSGVYILIWVVANEYRLIQSHMYDSYDLIFIAE